ncbi:MAG TPA: decarboxylase, partial [Mycobacterium sp.]
TGLIADLLAVRPETVLTPREAFFAADETVPLSRASGRIAAEAITPYPPGIPLVMPGERLDDDVIGLLTALRVEGNSISASDPTVELVKVVR